MNLLELARAELLRSNADRRHPFRYFWLATNDIYPELRTVVKRKADSDFRITLFTDSRSPKVAQIRKNDRISALFYHPRKKLQIRIRGKAKLVQEGPEYEMALTQIREAGSSKDYQSAQPPGTPVLTGDETELLETLHLLIIRLHPSDLDILQLGKTAHERAVFQWKDEQWKDTPVVP